MAPLVREAPWRSAAKGVSWRLVATLVTTVLSFVLTGTMEAALKIGPTDFVVKLVVFYLHERFWQLAFAQQLPHKQILKVSLWKVLAVSMTMATTVAVTGKLDLALKLGPADFFFKLFLYWAHEVMWDSLSIGRTVVPAMEAQSKKER